VRSVLGDPGFVRTVHGFGYAFRGEVSKFLDATGPAGTPAYRLVWGSREISLGSGENILGRGRDSVAWIDDPSISRRHAIIFIADQQATVEDLGSKNGTFLGGEKVEGQRPLTDGDHLIFGRVPMIFRVFRDGGPTQSVRST
jgi:FHA domain-containing protein